MPYEIYALSDFRGGLNVDASPESIADNEVVQADNCVLDVRGAIGKRKGTSKVNAASVGAQVTQLIEWRRVNGDTTLVAVTEANGMYKLHRVEPNGVFAELKIIAAPKIGWCTLRDTFYFVDGSEMYRWDGVGAVVPLEADAAADNNLVPIRKCKWLLWHPQTYRIYAAGNPDAANTLYYSEPNAPNYFKSTSQLVPTGGDGAVTAIALFAHALCVFYSDSLWAWKGVDPTTATWTRIPAPYGTQSPDSICLTPNSLTWLARGEIVCMNPALLDYNLVMLPGAELITPLSAQKVSSITKKVAFPEKACAVYDNTTGQYLLAYSDNHTNSRNTYVLVYDWTLQAFTRLVGWQVNSWCKRKSGDLLFGTQNYALRTGNAAYTDIKPSNGQEIPISLTMQTKRSYLGKPFIMKRLHKMLVAGHPGDAVGSTVDTTVESVGYDMASFPDVSFAGRGMKWGDEWGSPWAVQDLRAVELKPKLKGDRFQVTFTNAKAGESVVLYSLVMQYRAERKLKGVRYNG